MLTEIIAKLEKADGPSRELDGDIAVAVGLPINPEFIRGQAPRYTASLDAALTLVPEGWYPRIEPRFYTDPDEVLWRGYCIRPRWENWEPFDGWFDKSEALGLKSPALALCIAALRARQSS